ncbi:MAG: DNA cytosine methyltransferase [Planctomycetes bacterium]|nr:DNA cytosine methyltransferase [Planctomycetota bacterium]
MNYTCVDAFSGAGGLSLGLQRVGFNILLAFDTDPKCVETQRLNPAYFHHPVLELGIEDMLEGKLFTKTGVKAGELFMLAGGPPCQGFSVQRMGSDNDDRNNLVIKFVELICETLPYYFLIENVPGIGGKRGRKILHDALNQATKAGYLTYCQVLDAQDYGVSQRRRRVFVFGERKPCELIEFAFPLSFTPSDKRKTVRETIGHLPPPPDDGREHKDIRHHRKDKLSSLNLKRIAALSPGQGREHLPKHLLADCHRRSADAIGHRNVYGRMSWDEVAPTITARFDSFTRGLFGHPEQLRSITLREGALLQSFPKDFIFAGNKVEIARQIGNAVPPLLAEAIGKRILEHHEAKIHQGIKYEL